MSKWLIPAWTKQDVTTEKEGSGQTGYDNLEEASNFLTA